MSALPPKADMFSVKIDVRFVPIAELYRVAGLIAAGAIASRNSVTYLRNQIE